MWVGRILKYSNKWKLEKLGKVCEMGSGGTPLKSHHEYYGGKVKWAIIGDLNEGVINDTEKKISEKGLKNSSAKVVPKGTLLVGMYGSIGKTAITGCEMATNQAIAFLIPKKEIVNLYYLKYFIQFINSELFKLSKGQTQKNISQEILREITVPLPNIKEQQLIVSEIEKQFSRLDEATKSLKSLKTKLETYKKSVLAKSFHGAERKLSEIVKTDKYSIKRGPFGGSLKKEIFVPSGYKVYEQQHAINNDFTIGRYFITKEKFEEMKPFLLSPGDFIISCSGTIGKIAEAPSNIKKGIINQALLKISLNNSIISNKYFKYLFESEYVQRHLTTMSRGAAIKNVPSVKELKNITFPIPSLKDQEEIVQNIENYFSIVDQLANTINTNLSRQEQLKKSILKSAFEGKLVK